MNNRGSMTLMQFALVIILTIIIAATVQEFNRCEREAVKANSPLVEIKEPTLKDIMLKYGWKLTKYVCPIDRAEIMCNSIDEEDGTYYEYKCLKCGKRFRLRDDYKK